MTACNRAGCTSPGAAPTGVDIGDSKLCVQHLTDRAISEWLLSIRDRTGASRNFTAVVEALASATGRTYSTVRSELIDTAEAALFAGRTC